MTNFIQFSRGLIFTALFEPWTLVVFIYAGQCAIKGGEAGVVTVAEVARG